MKNEQSINFWTTIRWKKVGQAMLVLAPIAILTGLIIGMLTTSSTGCIELLPHWCICHLPEI